MVKRRTMQAQGNMPAASTSKAAAGSKPAASTEVAKVEQPGMLSTECDFGDDAGGGFENVTTADLQLPFLQVLQANSPQVAKPANNGGLAGAKAGMLHNTATDEIYDGEVGVVVVGGITQHKYIEWIQRDAGGGFVAMHEPDSELVRKYGLGQFGKIVLPVNEGTPMEGPYKTRELQETFYLFAVVCTNDEHNTPLGLVVIPFASKKIKPYKQMMSRLNGFSVNAKIGGEDRRVTPPLFANRLRITTFYDESSPKGAFYNSKLSGYSDNLVTGLIGKEHPAYQAAKKLRDDVVAGLVMASAPQQSDEPAGDPSNEGHF